MKKIIGFLLIAVPVVGASWYVIDKNTWQTALEALAVIALAVALAGMIAVGLTLITEK